MTVAELIEALKAMPQEAVVRLYTIGDYEQTHKNDVARVESPGEDEFVWIWGDEC